MENWGIIIRDISIFILLTTPFCYTFTVSEIVTWVSLLLGTVGFVGTTLLKASRLKVETRWLNWFEISKLVAGLLSLCCVHYFRSFGGTYTLESHLSVVVLLGVNMLEAIISDLTNSSPSVSNALAGTMLFCLCPFMLDDSHIVSLQFDTYKSGIFLFPLTWSWILCYSSWNSAFSYGFNFSHSTRLMLLTSFIVSFFIIQRPESWLGTRTYVLMLNMLFRAHQFTYLYTPGQSVITQLVGQKDVDQRKKHRVRIVWGWLNLLFVCGIWIAKLELFILQH